MNVKSSYQIFETEFNNKIYKASRYRNKYHIRIKDKAHSFSEVIEIIISNTPLSESTELLENTILFIKGIQNAS